MIGEREASGPRSVLERPKSPRDWLLRLIFGPPIPTYLQEHTTDEVRGRIFSLFFLAYNGATAIPILAAAALADAFGTARVIGGLGLLLCLAGAAVARGGVHVYGEEEA